MTRSSTLALFALAAAFGCSSSTGGSGGSSGSGGGGGSGGSGAQGVTVSCTVSSAETCTQIVTTAASVSEENSNCTTINAGTPGTGCSSSNILGCCNLGNASDEIQCFYVYKGDDETMDKSLCTSLHGTWSTTL